jgi:ABC-type transport system involved in cytochrome bd biosynthesis fused ATPase/permease subunit
MILADDFGLGEVLLSVLYIFGFVIFFWLLITIFADMFRNHEMSGWVKAFWVIFVIVFPFLGILIYLIVHGKDMAKRAAQQRQHDMDALRTELGTAGGPADELQKLADLKDRGAISDEEYQRLKAKVTA